ncbi:MAG: hypothetical protein JWQ03_3135 [Variovorax sp.]|nr:hypothetical protein [Variovorax sp.]
MDTISWAFNYVPWWVWFVAVLLALGFTIQFWLPIWAVTPRWLKVTLGAIGAILAAYFAGRNRGSKDERDQRARTDARTIQTRTETDHEINNLSPSDTDKRLDRWSRD